MNVRNLSAALIVSAIPVFGVLAPPASAAPDDGYVVIAVINQEGPQTGQNNGVAEAKVYNETGGPVDCKITAKAKHVAPVQFAYLSIDGSHAKAWFTGMRDMEWNFTVVCDGGYSNWTAINLVDNDETRWQPDVENREFTCGAGSANFTLRATNEMSTSAAEYDVAGKSVTVDGYSGKDLKVNGVSGDVTITATNPDTGDSVSWTSHAPNCG